ncbi:MAG: hypothetical protein KAG66_24715 [Methylococcales bacterium]|nr:hypothetical protein [Methylococcales bacterium]
MKHSPQEFHYRINWRSSSSRPGHHPGKQIGCGYQFHGHTTLMSGDPRHLDIHASLLDPFGEFMVRTFKQRSTLPVYAIADLSASMGFSGRRQKTRLVAEITASTAYSAFRSGDPFGFIGCTEQVMDDFILPLRRTKGLSQDSFEQLNQHQATGRSAQGILDTPQYIGRQQSLIFLISDFHFPLPQLQAILTNLAHHDVIPIVLWDSSEYRQLPKRGIARFCDAESGEERCLFMRPGLYQRIQDSFEQRRQTLIETCSAFGRTPFFVDDTFDPDQLTDYFFQR